MSSMTMNRNGDAGIEWGSIAHPERVVLATFADLVGDDKTHHLPTGELEVAAKIAFPSLDIANKLRTADGATLIGPDLQYAVIDVLRSVGEGRTGEILRNVGRLAGWELGHEDPADLTSALIGAERVDEDLRIRARVFGGFIAGALIGIRPEEI